MSFSRTPSGLSAEYLFFSEILVYVEGYTDIPFYNAILQNYNCRVKAKNGKPECEKLATFLGQDNYPYVVILDGHYDILERVRSQHRRIVLLHRHSYENYLFEEERIKQFCRDRVPSEDSLEEPLASDEFKDFAEDIEVKFKDWLILDVAHQRSKTGQKTFFQTPDRFFKARFQDNQIQKQQEAAAEGIDIEGIDDAKNLVEKYLRDQCLINLLPGHLAFGIMRRFISKVVGKSIPNDEIRLYLSRVVWQLVKTRNHNSLKRRLRKAVREAERIRQASNGQTQSNTNS
ncbi:DUF4435 domain-containing protein [Candidatus Poribacteria bacterium]|nr:DUF4435 domain-containing protein [Candidatus Poribacteria bacterium]